MREDPHVDVGYDDVVEVALSFVGEEQIRHPHFARIGQCQILEFTCAKKKEKIHQKVRMRPVGRGRRRKRLIRPDRLISDRFSGEMKSDGQGPNRRIDDPVHQPAGCCYSNKLTSSAVINMSGQSAADPENAFSLQRPDWIE